MSFAAVLHLNVADRHVEPRIKAALAGGFALRRIAATDEKLLAALKLVGPDPETGAEPEATVMSVALEPVVLEVAKSTGLDKEQVEATVIQQLRQVRAFTQLDADTLETNVGAVGNLIRSGRVELFAKTSSW